MKDSIFLSIALVILLPWYGFPVALAVSEYFADKPKTWEWVKISICAVCVWLIVSAMR